MMSPCQRFNWFCSTNSLLVVWSHSPLSMMDYYTIQCIYVKQKSQVKTTQNILNTTKHSSKATHFGVPLLYIDKHKAEEASWLLVCGVKISKNPW